MSAILSTDLPIKLFASQAAGNWSACVWRVKTRPTALAYADGDEPETKQARVDKLIAMLECGEKIHG